MEDRDGSASDAEVIEIRRLQKSTAFAPAIFWDSANVCGHVDVMSPFNMGWWQNCMETSSS